MRGKTSTATQVGRSLTSVYTKDLINKKSPQQRILILPSSTQTKMTSVPKAFASSGRLLFGLKACCRKPFNESQDGMKLSSDLCCPKPLRAFLVECVSCTVQCSGQHGCSQCNKMTCNFCIGFGEDNTLCHVCKHGTQRVVQDAPAEGAPAEDAPAEGAPADLHGAPPAIGSSTGAHQLVRKFCVLPGQAAVPLCRSASMLGGSTSKSGPNDA